jgi:chromosome segregation ATPase
VSIPSTADILGIGTMVVCISFVFGSWRKGTGDGNKAAFEALNNAHNALKIYTDEKFKQMSELISDLTRKLDEKEDMMLQVVELNKRLMKDVEDYQRKEVIANIEREARRNTPYNGQ